MGKRRRSLLTSALLNSPVRKVRPRRGHFSFSHVMDTDVVTHTRSNKRKAHEAELIPGVDGHRIFGFPNSIITKIRYCDSYKVTGALGARGLKVFSANGIYDPDLSGVGHQPMFHDNYFNLYDQYVVIGSKITVTYAPVSSTVPALIGITGNDDSSVPVNVLACMESNNAVSTLLGTTGSQPMTLTATFEPLEMFGVDAKDDGSSSTQFGNNPTELWCWGAWVAAYDGESNVDVALKVEIEYTIKVSELKDQTIN